MYRVALLAAVLLIPVIAAPGVQTSGIIRGRILNADGTPAAGVRVGAMTEDAGRDVSLLANIAETDGAGRYQIDGVRPGRYFIMAGRLETPTFYPGVLGREKAAVVNVTAGKVTGDIDFQVARASTGFKVSGRVTGLDAVTGARLPATVSLNGLTTTVNTDGSFEFARIAPGVYTARVSSAIPNARSSSVRVELTERDAVGVEIAVLRQKAVVGHVAVEGKGGLPRFGMLVTGKSAAAGAALNVEPQSNGTFRLVLLEGDQSLIPTNFPRGYRVKSFKYGPVDLTTGSLRIATTDTAELQLVVTTDAIPVRVRGRVTGLEGFGAQRSPVRMALRSPEFVETVTTVLGPDGTFEFPEVFPGSYAALLPELNAPPLQKEVLVVGKGNVDSIEFVVPPRKEIQGRIAVQGSAPIPRFKARWTWSGTDLFGRQESDNTINVDPQPDGTFKVTLFEGEYEDGEIILPAGYEVESVTYGRTNLDEETLVIKRNDRAEFRIRVSADVGKPVKVSGRVEGLDRAAPLRAATVSLTTSRYAEVWNVPVRNDGTFEFPRIFPGAYALRLVAPGIPADACAPVSVLSDDKKDVVLSAPDPGARPADIQIGSAIFGAHEGSADVTPIVRKLVKPDSNELYAATAWMEVDPAVGTNKQLTVSYLYRCVGYTFTTGEAGAVSHAMLVEHADPSRRPQSTGRGEFSIVSAYYGTGRNFATITPRIRELVRPDAAPFVVNDAAINGNSNSNYKHLIITYLYDGRRATYTTDTGRELSYARLVANADHPDDEDAAEVPDWLATAQPYAPREPGDPGPGYGQGPRKEAGIAALLKALAELEAISPGDPEPAIAGVISITRQALADEQLNYAYPPPGSKPILFAVRNVTRAERLDNARSALATALKQLSAANPARNGEFLAKAVEGIRQAITALQRVR